MTTYIIRRLLLVPLLLFGVTILIFGMLQFLTPAERASLYIRDIPKNERQLEIIIKHYNLNDPVYVQYWNWMVGKADPITGEIHGGILRGDFGYSRTGSEPVMDMIKHRFPATLELALLSVLPIIAVGIWLGVAAAVNHNKFIDQLIRVLSIIAASFPVFVFGLLLIMIFYAKLNWFPTGRYSQWVLEEIVSKQFATPTGFMTIDAIKAGRWDILLDTIRHLVLPVLVLSYISWATFVRVTRSSMLEALGQDYILTAREKGLSENQVVRKHALPNAMIPVTTMAGFTVVGLLGGVVITETIFNYPGIGSAAASAATQLDVVTVMGFALFNGFILIAANLIVDVLYGVIDPRVQLS
ncbi:MAG: ABC transporter permease [Pelolinea sp.]|nr:ABC transporter permease [Pelolinea sp.]